MELVLPRVYNLALKANLNCAFLVRYKPHLTAGKPEIRQLGLPAVNKLLLKNSCLIENRITSCGVALSCKAVKVAGGKSAEASVAETCVGLAFVNVFKLYAVVSKHAFKGLGKVKVVKVVLEGTSHKEFHAKIVNLLCSVLLSLFVKFGSALAHKLAQNKSNSFIILLVGSFLGRNSHKVGKLCLDKLLCSLFG